jgi:WD40 repeat protein
VIERVKKDNSELLVSGSWDRTIVLWNYDYEPVNIIQNDLPVFSLSGFSVKGKTYVISGDNQGVLKVWNPL